MHNKYFEHEKGFKMSGYLNSTLSIAMNMVEAKPVSISLVSGAVAMLGFNQTAMDAFEFGARNAVAVSAMDVVLTGMGYNTTLDQYAGSYAKYFDVSDFVAGAIGGATFGYFGGLSGTPLTIAAVTAGGAAAVAPYLSGQVVSMLMKLETTDGAASDKTVTKQ